MNTPVPIAVVAALRERIRCLEGGARHRRAVLPFGIKAIDERLSEGGLALGALHEVAGGGNGAIDGAAAALFAAGIAARTRGRVLWCVTRQDLFAPAIASAGLAPDRVIFVEAEDEKSVLACFEEGLRHGGLHGGGLGAVVAEVARLSMTASRRLQLAAEGSGAIGIAIRRLPYMRERVTPSPRLPSGRLRPSEPVIGPAEGGTRWTGYGEGPGEGALPQTQTRPPSSDSRRGPLTRPPPYPPPHAGERREGVDFSPQAGRGEGQPTAAVTRWRVSALPSQPLPVPGVGRARWRLELIRCRGGESACFEVEACDAQGRLALPSDLVHGSGQKAIGRRRTVR
jgi:protein ImuA